MSAVINRNMAAIRAYNSMNLTSGALGKAIAKLSSGLRIRSAADDAAGLAVSEKMRAQIRGLDRAVRNGQDGISMIQTAEGALNETHGILQRMRELSVQAANDALTQQDRAYIQSEIDQLLEEIDRIGNTAQFNKKKLLDGSAAALWSSSDLSTEAVINGGLLRTDRFGQKTSDEGNYKISIQASPGQAETLKTNIFTMSSADYAAYQAGQSGASSAGAPGGQASFAQVVSTMNKTYTTTRTEEQETLVSKTLNLNVSGLTSLGKGKKMNERLKTGTPVVNTTPGNNAHYNNHDPAVDMSDYDDLVLGDMELTLQQLAPGPTAPIVFTSLSGWYTREDGSSGRLTGTAHTQWWNPTPDLTRPAEVNFSTALNPQRITVKTDDPSKMLQIGFIVQVQTLNTSPNAYRNKNIFAWKGSQSSSLVYNVKETDPDKFYFKVGTTEYNVSPGLLAGRKIKFEDVAGGGQAAEIDFTDWTGAEIKQAAANGGAYTKNVTETKPVDVTETKTTTYAASFSGAPQGGLTVTDMYKGNGSAFDAALVKSMFDASGLSGVDLALSAEVLPTASGAPPVLAITGKGLDIHGNEVTVGPVNAVLNGTDQTISIDVNGTSQALKLNFNAASPDVFKKGDKFSLFVSDAAGADKSVTVTASDGVSVNYNFKNESVAGKTLELLQYAYDPNDGSPAAGMRRNRAAGGMVGVVIKVPDPKAADTAGTMAQPAVVTAQGNAPLSIVGRFSSQGLLSDPKTITVTQGDGKRASFTIYAGDTINSITEKLNEAIGTGLGQNKYTGGAGKNFARFVSSPLLKTANSVEGTIVINSAVAGKNGRLRFSGDEDVIKALGLNTLREARESDFRVVIEDAHTGAVKAEEDVTGNKVLGAVHKNVDVVFDAMAGTRAVYDEGAGFFKLEAVGGGAVTYLHLADNTTVLQIGANQEEDMGISIGDMRSRALGLGGISVTDRESAAGSVTAIDKAIDRVSVQRAKLGSYQNRLRHAVNNLTVAGENLTAAKSRIRDADMAKEMMRFTKLNILTQSGTAMMAQANQLPQAVLSLLR